MLTSGLIHYILNGLNMTTHIRDVCVFLAPTFSGLTAIATFLFTREVWNEKAGLFAACFIAIGEEGRVQGGHWGCSGVVGRGDGERMAEERWQMGEVGREGGSLLQHAQ